MAKLNCGIKDVHDPDERGGVLPSPFPLVPVGLYVGLWAVPLAIASLTAAFLIHVSGIA